MITLEHSVEIDRPAAEVFDYLADVERLPEWHSSVREVQADGPVAVGSRFRDVRELMGRRAASTLEVTALDRPERFSLRAVEGPIKYEIDHVLTETDGRTSVRVVGRANVPGLFGFAARPMVKAAERELKGDLARLKQVLEAR